MDFDPTKPVRTRSGRPARIIDTKMIGDKPIVAIVRLNETYETPAVYSPSGRRSKFGESPLDLLNVDPPEEYSVWVSLFRREDGSVGGTVRSSKEEAEIEQKIYRKVKPIDVVGVSRTTIKKRIGGYVR